MAYDIRLFKLITGDVVLGKYDAEKDCLNDAAILQIVPTKQGAQLLILPYGHPFENNFCGTLHGKDFIYRYNNTPEEIQNKYLEACTNLTMAGGMGKLQFGGGSAPASSNGSGLIS